MTRLTRHRCTHPGRYCGGCVHNRDRGGVEGVDWFAANVTPPPTRPAAVTRCKHLGPQVGVSGLYHCELYDAVTHPGRRCGQADRTCVGCPGHEPADGGM